MTRTTVQTPEQERRAGRWAALRVLWRESDGRVSSCRRYASQGGLVALRHGSAGSGFGGVVTCGSVWACPVCSAKIAAERASEVERVLQAHKRAGGSVLMVTLTVKHKRGDGLRALWDAVGHGWGKVTSGRGWVEDQARYGILGWLRVVEVTHGRNGWHVHVHALVLLTGSPSNRERSAFAARIHGRWTRGLGAHGFAASRRHGVDVMDVTGSGAMGDYFAKAVYEVTGANLKGQRLGNVTPFGILERLVLDGDAADLELWREWEDSSKGRRQLTWSRGLRDLYGLDPEASDEELAAQEEGDETVALIDGHDYTRLVEWGQASQLLDALDTGTWREFLAAHGVPWSVPPPNLRSVS